MTKSKQFYLPRKTKSRRLSVFIPGGAKNVETAKQKTCVFLDSILKHMEVKGRAEWHPKGILSDAKSEYESQRSMLPVLEKAIEEHFGIHTAYIRDLGVMGTITHVVSPPPPEYEAFPEVIPRRWRPANIGKKELEINFEPYVPGKDLGKISREVLATVLQNAKKGNKYIVQA